MTSSLVTCEMKYLRKAVNKTRQDKIRNEVIREMAGAKPVLQHIKQQQVKWFGHITRMPINQPALRAYNTKYSGWRARGMLLVGCLTSQQHASVSQGRICSDNFTCCHTEIEVADPTFHLTQSQYTDTGPTSPSADPNTRRLAG